MAIDGACRRNGKPDCVASGAVFIEEVSEGCRYETKTLSAYEVGSTNQRGELLALRTALSHAFSTNKSAQIITDSEYIFNAMTKEWHVGWAGRDWLTASFEPVKNSDLWKDIQRIYNSCIDKDLEIDFYHIKGHCIPFGKVTANGLLSIDPTGETLLREMYDKYDTVAYTTRLETLKAANELSLKNNGFLLTDDILRHFVVINAMADAIATRCVDAANSLMD
jgi:ribonuclease HI